LQSATEKEEVSRTSTESSSENHYEPGQLREARLEKNSSTPSSSTACSKSLMVFLELRSFLDYHRLDHELTYWRSRSQFEVDFLVGDDIGIEVKSKSRVSPRDYKGLSALTEEVRLKRKIVICGEKMRRRDDDGTEIMPATRFFEELWSGRFLD